MKKFWRGSSKINEYYGKRKSETFVAHWSISNKGKDGGMGGAMDGCGRVVKLCLIAINIATFIGGAVVLGVGIWVYEARSFPSSLIGDNMYIASLVVVVAMGAALLLLSVLGCCGAAKEVKCMLLTYYILVFLIFVVMLVGGTLQFIFREKVISSLDRQMYSAIPYYGVAPSYTRSWDETQTKLECCGVKSHKDWNGDVPLSCCREVYPGKRLDCKSFQNPTTMYMDGCLQRTITLLREDALYIGVLTVVIAILMLLALSFACGLFAKIQ